MNLNSTNLVVLNNGHVGVVTSFNGKPSYIITKGYIRKMSLYDENGKTTNDSYSIKEVYDGSSITDVDSVFKTNFNINNFSKIS